MALIGNQLSSAENNSYRVLDNLASFTLTFDGSSSANVLASTDTIALSQHPFVTGQRVTYSSGGGSPIGGLLSGTAYYITKTDQNSFKLAISYVNAITNINIDLVGPGTGVTHSFNVAFDGINTKFKATYSNGTKCTISRAPQLDIAINGVVQQPYDSNPPPNGFTIEADATIVFSIAPLSGYTFWGKALSGSTASFETSDNSIDNFTGDGSTTNFTLSKTPANSQNVLVTISGVTQYPSDATGTRSYSTNANVLVFTAAPANASLIQVRYIGFAGPTSSNVTGFYGRTGNVVLNSSDGIGVGTAKIGTGIVGLATALLVEGNVRITGILTIGTSSITLNGSTDTISARTVSTGSTVSIGASTIVVGNNFIGNNSIGLGATTTTGRNTGINTATGSLIFNSDTGSVQVYNGNAWRDVGKEAINATGGLINEYVDSTNGKIYRSHIFTSSGFFTVPSAPPSATVDYLVVAGGGGGGNTRAGGGGAGGMRVGSGSPITATSYTVTVGSGGVAGVFPGIPSGNGSSSVFSNPVDPITSQGGGAGGSRTNPTATGFAGQPGGSGGGGHVDSAGVTGGTGNRVTGTSTPAPSQGNPGGTNPGGSNDRGSGGGGASASGDIGGVGSPGKGGDGLSSAITGITTHYAGGGGAGCGPSTPVAGTGGLGGGGAGARGNVGNPPATPGTTATGGGGGGGADDANGGSGGSGIVVVRYEIGQVGGTAKATGGAISYTPTTTVHTFYSSGVFTVTNPALSSVDYLVVAGGGSGGDGISGGGGGGGAGGFRTGASFPVSTSIPVPITVGSGGAAVSGLVGGDGSPSIFGSPLNPITSAGGGGGGGFNPGTQPLCVGRNGGSGGGGGGNVSNTPIPGGTGNTPSVNPPQGNPGGLGVHNPGSHAAFGGGGGAGAAGGNFVFPTPGPSPARSDGGSGGNGLILTISGTATYYAGGGGGGGHTNQNGLGGEGGFGGGGRGSTNPSVGSRTVAAAGSQSTGGGGGGAGHFAPNNSSANGGSGIVIIAYPS